MDSVSIGRRSRELERPGHPLDGLGEAEVLITISGDTKSSAASEVRFPTSHGSSLWTTGSDGRLRRGSDGVAYGVPSLSSRVVLAR